MFELSATDYRKVLHLHRPSLEQMREMSRSEIRTEIAALCFYSGLADNGEVLAEAEMLAMDPDPQPERIVELWNQLRKDSEWTTIGKTS